MNKVRIDKELLDKFTEAVFDRAFEKPELYIIPFDYEHEDKRANEILKQIQKDSGWGAVLVQGKI